MRLILLPGQLPHLRALILQPVPQPAFLRAGKLPREVAEPVQGHPLRLFLRRQLGAVEEYLSGVRAWPAEELAEDMRPFAPMIGRLVEEHGTVSAAQAKEIIRRDVEDICRAILDNTAVFKRDEAGENALIAFLSDAGFPAKRRNI